MRLRLTVQRNGLPAANIVWSVPDTNSNTAFTIARLLENVNQIIPLEAEHWGLEHYVVEVDGFECLHFSPVAQALKEDDHVLIRPLMTAEVRARNLTGRHQISDDGRHLVDGVPFGRPYLRNASRPALSIPPRKRPRLDPPTEDEPIDTVQLSITNGEDVEQSHFIQQPGRRRGEARKVTPKNHCKTVHFNLPDTHTAFDEDDDDDDDEEDDDFVPGDGNEHIRNNKKSNGDSADIDSNSDSGSNSSSDLESDSGSASSSVDDTTTSGSDSDLESSSNSESESDSDSNSLSGSESDNTRGLKFRPGILSDIDNSTKQKNSTTTTTTSNTSKHVPPGQGQNSTRLRNARRVRANRLRKLKESGQISQDATLSDLQKFEDAKTGLEAETLAPSKPFSASLGKRKRLGGDESSDIINEENSELARKKRELIARFEKETSGSTLRTDEPCQSQLLTAKPDVVALGTNQTKKQAVKDETPSRRLRPDTAAIRRILTRQALPRVKKDRQEPLVKESKEPEGASDANFWKCRINLSAFECWEEDFELSAPPFPFHQHWDPASKVMRDKASKKKQKKGGKNQYPSCFGEDDDGQVVLDYDDAPTAANSGSEVNAAIEDQLRRDVAIATQADVPLLPEDLTILPDLAPSDIKPGAVIVCRFFSVNPVTVAPEISQAKTSTVVQSGDSGDGAGMIRLKIAERDLLKREKKYDSKGKRVYERRDRFFMSDDEENEADENVWEGMFNELLEAKLVEAA